MVTITSPGYVEYFSCAPASGLSFLFQYHDIQKIAVGTFGFPMSKDGPGPMIMCTYKYNNSSVDPEDESYEVDRQTDYCILEKDNDSLGIV